jgi:hypothetical protein
VQHGKPKQRMSFQCNFLGGKNMSVKLSCLEVLEACNSNAAKDVGFVLWLDTEIHRRSWNIMLFLNGMADILKTSLEIFKMSLDTVPLYSMFCCEVNQTNCWKINT